MDDAKDLAWRHYLEHLTQGRHHEAQRASVSQFTIAISAAVASLIGVGGVTLLDLPLAVFVLALGLFGALFSAKQYERFRYHTAQAKGFRRALQSLEPALDSEAIKAEAKAAHGAEFPRLRPMRLHLFWIALHLFVAGLGLALVTLVLCL